MGGREIFFLLRSVKVSLCCLSPIAIVHVMFRGQLCMYWSSFEWSCMWRGCVVRLPCWVGVFSMLSAAAVELDNKRDGVAIGVVATVESNWCQWHQVLSIRNRLVV